MWALPSWGGGGGISTSLPSCPHPILQNFRLPVAEASLEQRKTGARSRSGQCPAKRKDTRTVTAWAFCGVLCCFSQNASCGP